MKLALTIALSLGTYLFPRGWKSTQRLRVCNSIIVQTLGNKYVPRESA